MCGIYGAINLTGYFHNQDKYLFKTLTDMVHYRGPDASGYYTANLKQGLENGDNKFDVYLGHRRLSIIDLSDSGKQPLTDGNGLWITFNGEIFNYLELKSDLQKEGYSFKTNTDTEVILNIYRKYGESGFDKLNGMWAFALLDLKKKIVILSRDRFSIKPLYYIRIDEKVYFASEIKQLLPLMSEKSINRNVMFVYLQQGLLDYNDETFFNNVKKVKSKYNVIIDLLTTKIEEKPYWDYSFEDIADFDDAVDRFKELFIDSMKIRLRSDVKIGALLSGGLDSSTISLVANNLQNGNFETYSVIAEDKKYSEERFIDVLSRKTGIKNHKLSYNSQDALGSLHDVIYHNDEPFGSFSAVAQYNILQKIKNETDIVVVLSGQGGDEILLGYLKFYFFNLKDFTRRGHLIKALTQLMYSLINGTVLSQFKLSEARRYLPSYLPFLAHRKDKTYLKLAEEHSEPIWAFASLRDRQISDIDKYSVPALTHYEDRNSMAHSLEIRLPFLDHRLVNLVVGLNTEMKLNKGWTKYVLRKAFHELPEEIAWRKDKQGFITPEEEWLKGYFSSLINATFKDSTLGKMGIIDDRLFLKYYNRFKRGDRTIWYTDISRILIAELWAQQFLF
jgi:asparagine synthase (glutamine-hydrolysing)